MKYGKLYECASKMRMDSGGYCQRVRRTAGQKESCEDISDFDKGSNGNPQSL